MRAIFLLSFWFKEHRNVKEQLDIREEFLFLAAYMTLFNVYFGYKYIFFIYMPNISNTFKFVIKIKQHTENNK